MMMMMMMIMIIILMMMMMVYNNKRRDLGPVPERPISANPGVKFFIPFIFTFLCIA